MDYATGCAVKSRHYNDGTVIAVKIVPRPRFTAAQNWEKVRFEWGVRVRLVYDGVNTLPAKGWVENQHGSISSVKSTSGE